MRDYERRVLLSATDLMRFAGCQQATAFDLAWMQRREGPPPREDSADARILADKGDVHEAAHLEGLKAQVAPAGGRVVEIARSFDLAGNAAVTRDALAQGADIIFQGAFLGRAGTAAWGGWSDFLERVDRPSALGAFSYEVADTKLKRRVTPAHVLQLTLYSDLLAELQGITPERAHVQLGDGRRVTFRLNDYAAYARRVRSRLETFVESPWETRAIPCAACELCRWSERCDGSWTASDSLHRVAGITKGQVAKLEAAGIATMAALATSEVAVRGMAPETREKLALQARLQHARKLGAPDFVLRPPEPGRGFDVLPAPDPGDVFYDIEGDPHVEGGGLEYLHGVRFDGGFRAFWAHDRPAEGEALRGLMTFLEERLAAHPGARIYHYAAYEVTALKRLTVRHGIGEALLDRWLRERRFVDLYSMVRGALVASEDSYSIKSLEAFYGLERKGEVKTAGGSVVAYEAFRETGDGGILAEIEDYNAVDCLSTEMLRDWLLGIRPPEGAWPLPSEDGTDKAVEEDAEVEMLRELVRGAANSPERQAALFDLALFHKREAKPAWWAVFDSLGREPEELEDDLDALSGLVAIGPAEPVKQSMARRYRFPEQETKIRKGDRVTVPDPNAVMGTVSVEELGRRAGEVLLKVGKAKAHLLADRLTLHPPGPLNADVIRDGLREVIADQCNGKHLAAMDDLLNRRAPRLAGGPVADILGGRDPVAGTIAAVTAMQDTVLPIQGPPGTGKTYVTARAILALVRQDARVGVSASSHEAIRNVLLGCLKALDEADRTTGRPLALEIAHKVGQGEDAYGEGVLIHQPTSNDAAVLRTAQVVGGTAWFFARDENAGQFDWLIVDEAGQMGLATLLGMGRAARNVVLVGDPQQLPQVVQGSHPPPAGLSCLEWLLGDEVTIPSDRGIFLPVSRRMHPGVCGFISDVAYAGRLLSHPDTSLQRIDGTSLPATGAHLVPVSHVGRTQVAPEEVQAVVEAARSLLQGRFTDRAGTRAMTDRDVIVVAPYNAQVNALRAALDSAGLMGVRAGTVDKFQGQEAAVALVSMTASSAEDSHRGLDFLLSLNRINVAVSRAKALALVFASERLLDARVETVEQMRLANTLCVLAERDPGQHLGAV